MEYTEYYQFRKPTKALDIVKVGDINFNSEKIDELIHSTQVSLAPAYDATRTSSNPYMTGDVVMKDALMYKCLEDDVYGAWDATKWERTTAGEEGAGGSDIEPNPQGTPTDDLDTIGINGTIYNIAGSGGGGTALILDAQIYSTEERVVGVWIDNKPLYQKSYSLNTTVRITNSGANITSYIDNASVIEQIVNASGNNISTAENQGTNLWVGRSSSSLMAYSAEGSDVDVITLWYTKTTDTAGSGGYQAYGFSPIIYSTEEREVGVGANGKPLYQKTFKTGVLSAETDEELLSNVDSCYVVDLKTWTSTESRAQAPFYISTYNVSGSGTEYGIVIYDDDTNKVSAYNVGRSASIVIETTIQYTKTTDTAGSGSYNTLGVPTVHYSTDEQVVGTWIDGKTLYEKTYDKSDLTLTDNAWTNDILGTANSGIDIKKCDAYFMLAGQDTLFPYSYYRGQTEYFTSVVNGDSLNVRPNMNAGVNVKAGFITIRYTKSSS